MRKSINHGENNGRARLSLEAVKVIRYLLEQGHTGREIATVYGLSEGLVSGIKNRKFWCAEDEKLKDKWR